MLVYNISICNMIPYLYIVGEKNVVSNFLGRISYEFYIVHGFIVMLLADIILVENPHVNSIVVILLLLGLTIICALGMNGLCKIIHLLDGDKK